VHDAGTPVPAGEPVTSAGEISHRGDTFGAGWGASFFGVWNLKTGVLVAKFDKDQAGWERTWRAFQDLERKHGVPSWRRLNGWIALHVLIGLVVIPLLEVFLLAALLMATGRVDPDEGEEVGRMVGERVGPLLFLTGLVSWTLFVYVRPRAVRWISSSAVLLIGFAIAVAEALSLT